jgi:hypothetical protein
MVTWHKTTYAPEGDTIDKIVVRTVLQEDKGFFADHPGATDYDRQYVPGEFDKDLIPPGLEARARVRVTRLKPKLRLREMYVCQGQAPPSGDMNAVRVVCSSLDTDENGVDKKAARQKIIEGLARVAIGKWAQEEIVTERRRELCEIAVAFYDLMSCIEQDIWYTSGS